MKIGLIGAAAVAAIVVVGCGKKDAEPQGTKAETAAAPSVDPDKVAVLVNGEKLTYGKLDGDVAKVMAAQNVPAEQVEAAKKYFRDRLAQQFVMMTLLLGEAEKKGIKLTDEDRKKREAEFLKSVAGRPGAPKSIDELLAQHPFGKERARKEFDESLIIQKLIEDNATFKKQLDGLKGDALTNKFAQLAKEHSDFPSKSKGGDLGAFTRGQMVPEFDKVAFESEPLKVSDPVKTQFGWHLVMVTKKTPAVEAKGDKSAEPEKVQASHILVSARAPEKAPTKEEVEARMKRPQEQAAMQTFMEKLRAAAKIVAPDFPSLQPPKPEAPKAAAPKKAIESKPVEAKPAEAKPAEAPKPAAKPAEAKK